MGSFDEEGRRIDSQSCVIQAAIRIGERVEQTAALHLTFVCWRSVATPSPVSSPLRTPTYLIDGFGSAMMRRCGHSDGFREDLNAVGEIVYICDACGEVVDCISPDCSPSKHSTACASTSEQSTICGSLRDGCVVSSCDEASRPLENTLIGDGCTSDECGLRQALFSSPDSFSDSASPLATLGMGLKKALEADA